MTRKNEDEHRSSRPLRRVVIIGGGITGLSAAYRLQELARQDHQPIEVRLLEASERLGGHLRTVDFHGCLLEKGPDSILAQKPAARDLCRRLGINDEIVYPNNQGAGIRILKGHRTLPLPEGFKMAAPTQWLSTLLSPLFSPRAKWQMLREPFQPRRSDKDDESLGSFIRRRLGGEVLERVIQPILASIFLADADALSLNMVMPQLALVEEKYGSVIKGFREQARLQRGNSSAGPSFFSLKDGVSRLVSCLEQALPAGTVQKQTRLRKLDFDRHSGRWNLTLKRRGVMQADAVILACPFHAAVPVLKPHLPGLEKELRRTEYASCVTLNLVYQRSRVRRPMPGNGFFVPVPERRSFMACNMVHVKFPDRVPDHLAVMRVFVGGATRPDLVASTDERLVQMVHDDLSELMGIDTPPWDVLVHRYNRAMPQFDVGYQQKLNRIESQLQAQRGLYLAGGGMGSVGIPDCISCGEKIAERAIAELAGADTCLEETG